MHAVGSSTSFVCLVLRLFSSSTGMTGLCRICRLRLENGQIVNGSDVLLELLHFQMNGPSLKQKAARSLCRLSDRLLLYLC